MTLDTPTLASLTTVAGAAILVSVLLQFAVLPVLNLSPATRDRFGPLIAIVVGVIVVEIATLTVVTGATRQDVGQGLLNGIFAGLAAIGIHDVTSKSLR